MVNPRIRPARQPAQGAQVGGSVILRRRVNLTYPILNVLVLQPGVVGLSNARRVPVGNARVSAAVNKANLTSYAPISVRELT